MEQLLGVTRPTAQAAIDALVERGELAEVTGRERNRIYEASRSFDAVYGIVEVQRRQAQRSSTSDSVIDRASIARPRQYGPVTQQYKDPVDEALRST